MKKVNDLEQYLESALSSMDKVQRASPGPFFFTRVKARLDNKKGRNVWDIASAFIARPVVAIGMVVMVILLNTSVLMKEPENTENTMVSSVQTEPSFADEYNVPVIAIYDLENNDTR